MTKKEKKVPIPKIPKSVKVPKEKVILSFLVFAFFQYFDVVSILRYGFKLLTFWQKHVSLNSIIYGYKEPDTKTSKGQITEDVESEEPSEVVSEEMGKAEETVSEDTMEKVSPKEVKPSKKIPAKKPSKVKDISASEESPMDVQSDDELKSEVSSKIEPCESDSLSTSKATESIASKEEPDKKPKYKKDEKMTMDERIAAKKKDKKVKEEEPVFAGMKLKKRERVQRQWTEPELETVKLKDHQFEKLPDLEMVIF